MEAFLGQNWRTTSLGITTIAGAIVNLVFAIQKGIADQTIWMVCITNVVTGLGLIFSRDSQASAKDKTNTQTQLVDLQNQVSQVKNDTATMNKPNP